ncbi:MAG: glycosyltransferase family 2 protein [Candidatus Omnitrophica bacterium]|nr:glycosyltransferase family 2 protein [Candidatus Omnitrophota bacterium]
MKLCDIILLSYESPDLLKKCVESVLEHTNVKSSLIIVDNASKDPGVKQYLDSVHGNGTVEVEKIFSEENAGYAGGMNKGMRIASAPYICLLNNDCIVSEGWLEEMIDIARRNAHIGIVNPQSSTFGSRPEESVSINEHAALLSDKKGNYVELGHMIGFAALIKKEVIEKIGSFDEAYQGVCYEDTDFSARALQAGYISVMAEGSYVYHKEQASRKNLANKEEIYARNKKIFEERWGKLLRVCYIDSVHNVGFKESLPLTYENLRGLARERMLIDVWIRGAAKKHTYGTDNFLSAHIRHADVRLRYSLSRSMYFEVLWKVLVKKKKYDAIILRKKWMIVVLGFLKFIHRARIIVLDKNHLKCSHDKVFEVNRPSFFAKYLRKITISKP